MSDQTQTSPAHATAEDKTLPLVAYGLYLLGHATILPAFIALIMAYAGRPTAGPVAANHYTFLIRTFWLSIGWWVIGLALVLVGIPLSLVLIGIPILGLGALILGAVWIWAVARCILGVIYLAQDQPYPRPQSWLF